MQFSWWAYHLINLSKTVYSDQVAEKRVLMIVGEGSVFFVLLLVGVWLLQRSMKREMALNKDQKNFLLATTHELKTPISTVKLFLETLKKHNLPEEKKIEIIDKALGENDRLNVLIDKVLMASRIESGHNVLSFSNGNLSDAVSDIVKNYQTQYPNRSIESVISKNVVGSFDAHAVHSILSNLIENALKYSDEHEPINVGLIKQNNYILIKVMDNGQGIGDVQKVVKLFYREQNEETRTEKGSGLGLFIVDQLCQLHGGHLNISSELGKGSVFTANIKLYSV